MYIVCMSRRSIRTVWKTINPMVRMSKQSIHVFNVFLFIVLFVLQHGERNFVP